MKIIVYINFVLTVILIGCFIWFIFYYQKPEKIINQAIQGENKIEYVDKCGDECRKQIEEIVSKNTTETIKTVTITPVPVKSKTQIAYIPISGSISTTSSTWYDAPGTDFYLDFNTDYGKNAYANWQVFLKVAHGNGTAYARLYDVTNKIAVNGSEVKITDQSNLTQVESGALSFWAGNNLYRVQIKSLNTFEVTFGSGRIKFNY